MDDPESKLDNIAEVAQELRTHVAKDLMSYKAHTNNVMVQVGDDFKWGNAFAYYFNLD